MKEFAVRFKLEMETRCWQEIYAGRMRIWVVLVRQSKLEQYVHWYSCRASSWPSFFLHFKCKCWKETKRIQKHNCICMTLDLYGCNFPAQIPLQPAYKNAKILHKSNLPSRSSLQICESNSQINIIKRIKQSIPSIPSPEDTVETQYAIF